MGKDPSPLAERLEQIGGCEMMRLLECPSVLGFLKPAVTVQCASGERIVLPLDSYGNAQALRTQLAKELKVQDGGGDTLTLTQVNGDPLKPLMDRATGEFLDGPCTILCARPGELIATAKTALAQRTRPAERDELEELCRIPNGMTNVRDIQQEEA